MKVDVLVFSPFQENTYVIHDESKSCVVIDPGMLDASEKKMFDDFISRNNLKIEKIINTHCHLDHVFGVKHVMDTYKVPFYCHQDDHFLLSQAKGHAQMYGIPFSDETAVPTGVITDGEIIKFGNSQLEARHIPGHSPGGIVFYSMFDKFVIAGDVLFKRSVGRSDLPGGNHEQLIAGIFKNLMSLPDDCVVFSGHGSSTTIGDERLYNDFLN